MSLRLEPDTTITDMEALSQYISYFIAEFKNSVPDGLPVDIDYIIHPTRSGYSETSGDEIPSPIRIKKDDDRLVAHLYQSALVGIPALALQGWLDLELATQLFTVRQAEFQFNFKRDIIPLINVSGMAVQLMRHLVFHLETSLKQAMAARIVLDMDHNRSLFYYFYSSICPSKEDKDNYQNLVPHHWIRAIFLCKKLRQHTAVALLSRNGLFAEIESFWWSCNDYFLPEDKHLMEELADISHQFEKMHFSDQLVAMFKTVNSRLLN